MRESNLSDKIRLCCDEFGCCHVLDIKEAVQKLMNKLESQLILGNKLNFTHTIVSIKEIFGPQLCAEQTMESVEDKNE